MKNFDDLRELAKTSLAAYASVMHNDWQPNWHHRVIIDAVERCVRGEPGWDKLIISMPPRMGKTAIISTLLPGWYMANHPYETVIVTTYGSELSDSIGRQAREYASTELFEPLMGVSMSKDTSAITKWSLNNHSTFFTTSVGGALTGLGANLMIVDDPVKNREEAESEGSMQKIFDWFTSTAYTRLEKNGRMIVVMTRWSKLDLAGRLLESDSGWREIAFPAIAEKDEEFRKKGDPLWPDKFGLDKLNTIRSTVGRRDWASLFQQRPAPEDGNIFKEEWFKFYRLYSGRAPMNHEDIYDTVGGLSSFGPVSSVIQSWDTAVSNKSSSARSACTTWVVVDGCFYLVDAYAEPLSFPELRRKVAEKYRQWRPDIIYVEEQQTGRPLIDELKRTLGHLLVPVRLRGNKETRAKAASVAFETGRVYLPHRGVAAWVDDFIGELMGFPSGRFADQVDSTSQAMVKLMKDAAARGERAQPAGGFMAMEEPIGSIFAR